MRAADPTSVLTKAEAEAKPGRLSGPEVLGLVPMRPSSSPSKHLLGAEVA